MAMKEKGNHIITTNIEHHAVLNPCKQLELLGFEVTYLEVDENGRISTEQVINAITDRTILVTVMYGNNEVGTIQPIREIGEILKDHQAVFHTDAVQAYGLIPLNVDELGVDLLSVTAHKLNGPKGIGFLYQRKGLETSPLIFGESKNGNAVLVLKIFLQLLPFRKRCRSHNVRWYKII